MKHLIIFDVLTWHTLKVLKFADKKIISIDILSKKKLLFFLKLSFFLYFYDIYLKNETSLFFKLK